MEKKLTSEIMEMFAVESAAEEWIERIICNVAPWINKKGKSYWDLVRFHGHYQCGVLKELSRQDFAKLLYSACREGLDATDTTSTLYNNMVGFLEKKWFRRRTKDERRKQAADKEWVLDLESDSSSKRLLLKELDDVYNKQLILNKPSTTHTLKSRMMEYFNALVDHSTYSKVYDTPTYGRYTPDLSCEEYLSSEFMNNRKPTKIYVVECVGERVTESKVNELAARYFNDRRITLFIASSEGYDNQARSAAESHQVVLARVNTDYEVTPDCFVTARSVSLYNVKERNMKMLSGGMVMNVPFVILDNSSVTTSLAEVLYNHDFPIRKELVIKAPFLTDSYIEQQAFAFVKTQVDEFVEQMHNYRLTRKVPCFDGNPEKILHQLGYTITDEHLLDSCQLAIIDFRKKAVTLPPLKHGTPTEEHRRRYSLAHEAGHAVLHGNLNINIFGEDNKTLDPTAVHLSKEQKWLEHHANFFASCLLMPQDVVGYLYSFFCQQRFGKNVIRKIIIGPQKCQQDDFYAIVRPIMKCLNVSIEALKYRLIKLGLAEVDEKAFNFKKAHSAIFSYFKDDNLPF